MKFILRFTNILLYLFLIQVYPYVHWHGHEHGDKLDIHLSIHFPEISIEIHENEHQEESSDDHNHPPHHQHNVKHSNGDWDYTIPNVTYNFKITPYFLITRDITAYKPQFFKNNQQAFPLKLPLYFFSSSYSHRAPPQLI